MWVTTQSIKLVLLLSLLCLTACDDRSWNDPYPNQSATENTLYTAFIEEPKHLDPAITYSADELQLISQIYEPIIEYNYLLRPYKLQPLTAAQMPSSSYDARSDVTTFKISIKPGIMYQPHPALARDLTDKFYYHNLTKSQAYNYTNIMDFKHTGTRELTAADYAYQIKRLVDPKLNSPIFGFMSKYIVGFAELRAELNAEYAANPKALCADLRKYNLSGVKVIDDYNYTIKIHGKYDQFIYWLEMPFFAPIPWEATSFYCQAGMERNNISLDTYPIGTGAFYLTVNNPNRNIIMQRNPNFHPDFYPRVGMPEDFAKGLLTNAGKQLPFIDKIIFSLEKESIPYWDKFLQGYYDRSTISSDNFNSAISSVNNTGINLTPQLLDKGIKLSISDTQSLWYWGFNMLDETVGGDSVKAIKLRKAISLAFDMQEYIAIFLNGRALVANGPIPPGIDGYSVAPLYDPKIALTQAKKLLAEAGYPNGHDKSTGAALQLFYDAGSSGDPNEKARLGWIRKQFTKLGINLIVRVTDYNSYQDKVRTGNAQIFSYAWNADYPDPENFFFIFYGPNGVAKHNGINLVNYNNQRYDRLFEEFKAFGNNPKRMQLIPEMIKILQDDTPCIWGFFPTSYILSNAWYAPSKPSTASLNTLKYVQIDPVLRANLRKQWNEPMLWPFILSIVVMIVIILPAIICYLISTNTKAKRIR